MQLGEVYFWQTGKVRGHVLRNKYHIYVCSSDWREGNTFLFINKADYGGDLKITKTDCPFLDLDVSYISCSSLVFYSDEELASFPKKPVSRLSRDQLKKLYNALRLQCTESRFVIHVSPSPVPPTAQVVPRKRLRTA